MTTRAISQLHLIKKPASTKDRLFVLLKIKNHSNRSEPTLTACDIGRNEFVIALSQIDDAFDQADDARDKATNTQRQHRDE